MPFGLFEKKEPEPKCPYCNVVLPKFPGAKTKCKACGKYYYARRRPSTMKKSIVTEEELSVVEKEWETYFLAKPEYISAKKELERLLNREPSFYEIKSWVNEKISLGKEQEALKSDPNFIAMKKDLAVQFGRNPSIFEVRWELLNKELVKNRSNKDWGLYCCVKHKMGELLKSEGQFEESLAMFFQVAYLDTQGCNNVGGIPIENVNSPFKEFEPNNYPLGVGVLFEIKDLLDLLKIPKEKAKTIFIKVNEEAKPYQELPIPTDSAWRKLAKEIYVN